MNEIPALARVFASLSLMTLGGGLSAYPALKTQAVDVHGWLTESQLEYLYSLGQLAPGPNMMVASIGEWTAGLAGAAVAVLAFLVPTALLAMIVGRVWGRLAQWRWTPAIQRGLRSVSVGLLLAGCAVFARGVVTDWTAALITLVAFALVLHGRINPALIVVAGGLVGVAAYGPR